jgi:hypothetical protein
MARTLERPAGSRQAGLGLAVSLMLGVALAWLATTLVVLRLSALSPEESGKLFVVFPPGTSESVGFAAIVAAGGAPLRTVLGGWGWIAHDDAPAFVGRLRAAGALAAFRGAPGGLSLAGCFAFVADQPRLDPFARALEARFVADGSAAGAAVDGPPAP